MAFFIRLNDEEKDFAESDARLYSYSFGEACMKKIEDEYDIVIANEAYQDYLNSGCKATTIDDFWREMDAE